MIFFLLLLPIFGFTQDFTSKSFTTGVRSSFFTDPGKFDNSFVYYQPEYSDETFGTEFTTKKNLKFRVFDYFSSDEYVIVDPLDVSVEFLANKNSFQIGFLRYRFSETFGFQLLDIANPRDYSEFIFNDLAWAKRSVFGMNSRFNVEGLEVQLMLTLWPNGDRLPYKGSQFDVSPGVVDYQGGVIDRPWFKDLEYGTRFKYLFKNGFDLGVLAYHHFTRPTFNQIDLTTLKVRPTNEMVNSFGTSGSYIIGDWVLRGDFLFTGNDLVIKNAVKYEEEDHSQGLFGIDRTVDDYVFGIQTQSDFTTNRHFGGLRLEKNNLSNWKPSMMIFQNYAANDYWFQIKNQFNFKSASLNLVYDSIHGGTSKKEVFGYFRKNDRVLVDVSFNY